jgi:hypothetical protein
VLTLLAVQLAPAGWLIIAAVLVGAPLASPGAARAADRGRPTYDASPDDVSSADAAGSPLTSANHLTRAAGVAEAGVPTQRVRICGRPCSCPQFVRTYVAQPDLGQGYAGGSGETALQHGPGGDELRAPEAGPGARRVVPSPHGSTGSRAGR